MRLIFRAYRCHLAKLRVTGQRFQIWQKEEVRQKYALLLLAENNTTTVKAISLFKLSRFISNVLPSSDYLQNIFSIPAIKIGRQQKGLSESLALSKECKEQIEKRKEFMVKANQDQDTNYFSTGFKKLTTLRKISAYFLRDTGLRSTPGVRHFTGGNKGVQSIRNKAPLISGTDRYSFSQFVNSPHVRYDKLMFFQGEWGGLPLVTTLKPHGEGLVIFMNASRFQRGKPPNFISPHILQHSYCHFKQHRKSVIHNRC